MTNLFLISSWRHYIHQWDLHIFLLYSPAISSKPISFTNKNLCFFFIFFLHKIYTAYNRRKQIALNKKKTMLHSKCVFKTSCDHTKIFKKTTTKRDNYKISMDFFLIQSGMLIYWLIEKQECIVMKREGKKITLRYMINLNESD